MILGPSQESGEPRSPLLWCPHMFLSLEIYLGWLWFRPWFGWTGRFGSAKNPKFLKNKPSRKRFSFMAHVTFCFLKDLQCEKVILPHLTTALGTLSARKREGGWALSLSHEPTCAHKCTSSQGLFINNMGMGFVCFYCEYMLGEWLWTLWVVMGWFGIRSMPLWNQALRR